MDAMRPDALVVEDDPTTLSALATLVEKEGFEVRTAMNLAAAREALEHLTPDVVLSDVVLPDGEGTELLAELRESTDTEVILVTGNASVESVVEALRLGAYDYLTKPIDQGRLKTLLANVGRTRELKQEISSLRRELRELGRFGSMVGTSKPMQRTYELIEKVAVTDATVLLIGKSGTGKELAAATIHELSRRKKARFVAVNCGAVASTLIESELFGHEKGAFTGATRQHRGYFEQADRGTLLLDEITEMDHELQVKLLRVLETQSIQRVGGSGSIEVDVRVIAATNQNPEKAVEQGRLREDLYYRLNVFPIRLPRLCERHDDIELLARHFLAELGEEQGVQYEISEETLAILQGHDWPGNVRELRNVLQRAAILCDGTLTPDCLPAELGQHDGPPSTDGNGLDIRVGMSIAEAEQRLILASLDQLEGNKKKTAELLGISLKTLYNRLKAYRAN